MVLKALGDNRSVGEMKLPAALLITTSGRPGGGGLYLMDYVKQALFLCNICVVFRPVLPFENLLFIHTLTNATDDHKYSPLPSADFDSSAVLASFSAFIFS